MTGHEPSFADFRIWMFFELLVNQQLDPALALNKAMKFHGI